MERLVLLCLLVAGTTAIEAKRKSEGEPGIMPLTPAARESLINKMKRIIDDAGIPYSFDEVAFRTDLMKTLNEINAVIRSNLKILGRHFGAFVKSLSSLYGVAKRGGVPIFVEIENVLDVLSQPNVSNEQFKDAVLAVLKKLFSDKEAAKLLKSIGEQN
uniref:Secreted protein n=1 Tax=Bursaphelenchus xylophilus TaxID=6326 RepID=A0A1I7SCV8_BURXY